MGSLLQPIFELLTTATGTLAYHLVLAFTILGAFQVTFFRLGVKTDGENFLLRQLFGLGCLLALQFILFVFSGLAWQGVLDGGFWLPPVDRAVILLSLVCILWMWIFPIANLKGDLLALALAVFLFAGVIFGFFWWQGQYPNLAYNSSWADFLAQVVALILLLGGAILLIVRRTPAWLVGLIMFALFATGHMLHLLLPLSGEQYSGAVRAAQLAAFPFLFMLAQRSSEKTVQKGSLKALESGSLVVPTVHLKSEKEVRAAISRILEKNDEAEIYQQAVFELAKISGAQVCLYLEASGDEPLLSLLGGYNTRSEQAIASISLDGLQLPRISQAYHSNSPVVIQSGEFDSDLNNLGRLCNFEPLGNLLLLVPGKNENEEVRGAALLASPVSDVIWEDGDQAVLSSVMNLVVQHLLRSRELSGLKVQLENNRQNITETRKQLMRSDQGVSMNNELRLALEEIASLRANLSELERKTGIEGPPLPETKPDLSRLEQITNITHDIQQPLASLKDYTGILLSEQYGVLGEKQQRNLERIRVSAERIGRLITELSQVVSIETQVAKLSIQEINLGNLISQVEQRYSNELRGKDVFLIVDRLQQDLSLFSDKQALTTVLDQMFRYCISLTPPQGQINLVARLEHKDNSPDYALIQWICNSFASQQGDVSQLFSPYPRAAGSSTDDAVSGKNLFEVRSLVEALGGRIWVDIEQEKNTIFSMILPVIHSTQRKDFGDLEADV